LEKVMNKELDLALGRWDFLPSDIESHTIALAEVLVAIPQDHSLSCEEAIQMGDLSEGYWVTLAEGCASPLRHRFANLATSSGFKPKSIQTVPDSLTLLTLVGLRIGCAITLDSVRDNTQSPDVVFKPLRDKLNTPLDVRLIWRKDIVSPAVGVAVNRAKKLFVN